MIQKNAPFHKTTQRVAFHGGSAQFEKVKIDEVQAQDTGFSQVKKRVAATGKILKAGSYGYDQVGFFRQSVGGG